MENLTPEDCTVLLEALKDWQNQPHHAALLGFALGAMMAPPDKRQEIMAEREKKMDEALEIGKQREERATFLKVKLLTMRDRSSVESLMGERSTP